MHYSSRDGLRHEHVPALAGPAHLRDLARSATRALELSVGGVVGGRCYFLGISAFQNSAWARVTRSSH